MTAGIAGEPAIPFRAFPAAGPLSDDDVLADEMDGAVFLAVPPSAPEPVAEPGGAVAAGRAVIALALGDADLEAAIDTVLAALQGRSGALRHHRPSSDLAYWGEVDAERGRAATELDAVICLHSGQLLTVEVPAASTGRAVAALSALPWAGLARLDSRTNPGVDAPLSRAALWHGSRTGGRAEVFPGQQELRRDVPVALATARTAIDQVLSSHGRYHPDAVLRTHGFVRPRYESGRLVLRVGHDDPALLVPWEVRYSPPCCADH